MRRSSARSRGPIAGSGPSCVQLRANGEPVREVVDLALEDVEQGAALGPTAHGRDRVARLREGVVDRVRHLVGEPFRLVLERRDLGQPALLELRVPQVLRQAVVDLAGEARAFLEGRCRELGLGQATDLHRRRPQLGEVVPAVDDDPDEQHPVEGQAQAGPRS